MSMLLRIQDVNLEEFKNINLNRVEGMCEWVLKSLTVPYKIYKYCSIR